MPGIVLIFNNSVFVYCCGVSETCKRIDEQFNTVKKPALCVPMFSFVVIFKYMSPEFIRERNIVVFKIINKTVVPEILIIAKYIAATADFFTVKNIISNSRADCYTVFIKIIKNNFFFRVGLRGFFTENAFSLFIYGRNNIITFFRFALFTPALYR